MKDKDLNILIEKYLSGNASEEEKEIVDNWYRYNNEVSDEWDLDGEDISSLKNRMQSAVWSSTIIKEKKKIFIVRQRVAAAALVFIIATFAIANLFKGADYQLIVKIPETQIENRYITLPDSSIVILRPGGELLVSEDFGSNERKVELIGEAYFDIRPNIELPFVIKTGKIKTTVLGTAFSIKAKAESTDIEVLVDHGKVRVENEKEVLGELIAEQKLIVAANDFTKKEIVEIKEKVHQELSWKEDDMRFEGLTFGELVKKLERRYNVSIDFKNSELSHCKISGVYSGIESLDDVLTNLCITSNTTFKKINNNHFLIEGEKCF